MSSLSSRVQHLFPLRNIDDVLRLFDHEIGGEPDLTLLSLVIGIIENTLTTGIIEESGEKHEIPLIGLDAIEPFYTKFVTQIRGSIDLTTYPKGRYRELIKKVSDVIWSSLTRSYYKDKAHLQTLFSYMTGNKLDCFGVAYAVVAGCQVLRLDDVRLALSEDHAWVVFGPKDKQETAEVTWHGKGNEDKRGQPVISANSWLYLNGYPVVCNQKMTVAALASAINPSINSLTDSEPLIVLQHRLLWLLYNRGHLSSYPMAIGNLGDMEEMNPLGTKSPLELFKEAIEINKKLYDNHHVYPYSYLAGYFYRNGRFKEALETWASAASVIRRYNYTRDDEEIYKEFLEIANDLILHMVKVVSAGGCEPAKVSKIPLLQDPECFAFLLEFYDGLCGWEEGSSTPVLHIGWAKPFVATIGKFSSYTRNKITIKLEGEEENGKEDEEKFPVPPLKTSDEIIASIESDKTCPIDPKIAELAATCSEEILNPEFLLGNSNQPTLKMSSLIPNQLELNPREKKVEIILKSQKMKGLKDLLLAEKLNTSAIQLQLTAQSQVHLSKRPRGGSFGSGAQPEFDFLATTTLATSLNSLTGQRTSKRSRRD